MQNNKQMRVDLAQAEGYQEDRVEEVPGGARPYSEHTEARAEFQETRSLFLTL